MSARLKDQSKVKAKKDWCPRCVEREDAPDPRMPLKNPRWEAFARNIAVLKLSNPEAYRKAGFTSNNTSNTSAASGALRRKIEVQNRIIAMHEYTLAQDMKTAEWVDDGLKQVVDRCMQAIPVKDTKGNKTGEWKFNAQGANTALATMAKIRGMLIEKLEVTGIDAELKGKSQKEIEEMIVAMAVDLGRDFVKQLMEAVGLEHADSTSAGGIAKVPSSDVPPLH